MPRFHPDTIAALAEGRLDPEQAREVERAIGDDPVALAELTAHRTALAAASSALPITLSAAERDLLRSTVSAALGVGQPESEPVVRRRQMPWAAISVAAAALVAMVAAAPLANLLSTGDESAAAPTFDAALEANTTVADGADPVSAESVGDTPSTLTVAGADGATTTMAVSENQRTGDEEARARLTAAFAEALADGTPPPDEETPCYAEAVAYLGTAPTLTVSLHAADGGTVVAFSVIDEEGMPAAAAGFDPADCTIAVILP